MSNILEMFNVIHFPDQVINDYFNGQIRLSNGVAFYLNESSADKNIDSFKNQITNNIAMVESNIFDELFKFKYHIHHDSQVYIELKNFNGKRIWGEIKSFDDHISFFKNYDDFYRIIKSESRNSSLTFFIKVLETNSKQIRFNEMIQSKNIPLSYINEILKEVCRSKNIKSSLINPDTFLDCNLDTIIKNNATDLVKTNIKHFKETYNLFFLLQLCNNNLWTNSNF